MDRPQTQDRRGRPGGHEAHLGDHVEGLRGEHARGCGPCGRCGGPRRSDPCGLPVPIHTPGNGEGPAEPKDGALDIIDALEGRIREGLASGEMAANPTEKGPGNDRAAEAGREVAVSPALAQAAKRLVSVGCPPLRVEKRYGGLLALHLLQSKDTFTAYAESKGLSGSALREVMTIARALDLATQHQGAQYLISEPAEVQLRRFYSVILASKLGSFKLSQFLEEVPGDSALAEIPDSVLKMLSERLKLEMKLEQLARGSCCLQRANAKVLRGEAVLGRPTPPPSRFSALGRDLGFAA